MLRIRELRKEKKISQVQLAEHLGVTQATLSGWETGKYNIDNESLKKCADYFSVSVDYLLGRSKDRMDEELLGKVLSVDADILRDSKGNFAEAWKQQEKRDSLILNRLKQAIRSKHISDAKLSEILGVKDIKFENLTNEKYFNSFTVTGVAKALGVNPDWLMGYDVSANPVTPDHEVNTRENNDIYDKDIRLLARHLQEIPKGHRDRLIKNFEDTLEMYLDAKKNERN